MTFLASNSHDLQQVQKFACHSSVNMTRAYFSASYLGTDEMSKTIDKMLGPGRTNSAQALNGTRELGLDRIPIDRQRKV